MTLRSVLTNDFDPSVQCLSLSGQLKHHPDLLVNLSFLFDTSLIHPLTHSSCPVTTLYDAPSQSPPSVSVCHRLQTQCCIPTCTARYFSIAKRHCKTRPDIPLPMQNELAGQRPRQYLKHVTRRLTLRFSILRRLHHPTTLQPRPQSRS